MTIAKEEKAGAMREGYDESVAKLKEMKTHGYSLEVVEHMRNYLLKCTDMGARTHCIKIGKRNLSFLEALTEVNNMTPEGDICYHLWRKLYECIPEEKR